MGIEASQYLQTEYSDDSSESEPEPSITLVPPTSEAETQTTSENDNNDLNIYDQFLREAGTTLSKIGVFTIRRETAMVRLMSGDVIGNDYGEGLFNVGDPAESKKKADDQTALRLRWAAAAAVVNEKDRKNEAAKFEGTPEELEQHLLQIDEYNKPLKDITREAIRLHFKLRVGRSHQTISEEIEKHFTELSEREMAIYQNRIAFKGAIAVRSEVEAEEVEKRLEHSLHKHRKLKSVIYRLQLSNAQGLNLRERVDLF